MFSCKETDVKGWENGRLKRLQSLAVFDLNLFFSPGRAEPRKECKGQILAYDSPKLTVVR